MYRLRTHAENPRKHSRSMNAIAVLPSRSRTRLFSVLLRSVSVLFPLQRVSWARKNNDPVVIDYRQDTNLHMFKEGYFVTSEPTWSEPGKFGVRLGNILEVISKPNGYLGFREATLIPFEPKLIDRNLLTDYEINWLNAYNERIRKIVGPELNIQGLTDVYYWMMNKTLHIELPPKTLKHTSAANHHTCELKLLTMAFIGILTYIML